MSSKVYKTNKQTNKTKQKNVTSMINVCNNVCEKKKTNE